MEHCLSFLTEGGDLGHGHARRHAVDDGRGCRLIQAYAAGHHTGVTRAIGSTEVHRSESA
jgi:hypothetical protein